MRKLGKSDLASFRLFTSQLIVQGSATQGHVARAFGVPLVAIKRATKLYRERGPAGFFVSGACREGSKLNAEKLEQARALLVQGHPLPVVSAQTGYSLFRPEPLFQGNALAPLRG